MKDKFYVYGLFYGLDKCFYIGKGSDYRMSKHFCRYHMNEDNCRNLHKVRKIKKLRKLGFDPFPKKIYSNLNEDLAYELEKFLISEIGLKNLTNISEGGVKSPSGKQHYMFGKSRSEEWKNKVGDLVKGERNVNSKISRKEAREIKWLSRNTNKKDRDIADKYNLSNIGIITNIRNDLTWEHVSPTEPDEWEPSVSAKIRWLVLNTNLTQQSIADYYDVNQSVVSRIKNNKKSKRVKKIYPRKPEEFCKNNFK